MRRRRLYQVDAFTRTRFAGNPAGVLTDADGLSEAEMLAVARELNNSETAFIFPPRDDTHDVHVRFFTPTVEVPVCGHATIAAHYVRALEQRAIESARQLTGAGVMRIDTERIGNGQVRIWMQQKPAAFSAPLGTTARTAVLAAMRLDAADLGEGPSQIVSTGHSKVIIPLRSRETLARLRPDLEALRRLSVEIGCNGYYPFVLASADEHVDAHARMFAPAIGIAEDPSTGNAAGPLAAYLLQHRICAGCSGERLSIVVAQGHEVGRPGEIRAHATLCGSGSIEVTIGGDAVVAFQTEIMI